MSIQHSAISNADLHECKGASAATAGQSIIAGGAGTATFKYANPHGSIYFENIAAPYVLTYPTVATKAAPTTTASGTALEFTEATTARLTYTGADTIDMRIIFNVSLDQASGANRDVVLYIYKNGSVITGSSAINTTSSAVKVLTTSVFDIPNVATNDYFEAYIKNTGASGDVNIYTFVLTMFGMRG